MRISDWSSDVCSSELEAHADEAARRSRRHRRRGNDARARRGALGDWSDRRGERRIVPVSLAGKTVLVTGGSRGIGAAIVRRLGQVGAHVAINYEGSRDAAEEIGRASCRERVCQYVEISVVDGT